MADNLGDPIFIFFVVFMVLLFMILLIKRLNKKPSPLDLEFAAREVLSRGRNHQIPTISVAVHLHERHGRPTAAVLCAQHMPVRTATIAADPTPPPPFESVVGQTGGTGEKQTAAAAIMEPPPPSYEEYLILRDKFPAQ